MGHWALTVPTWALVKSSDVLTLAYLLVEAKRLESCRAGRIERYVLIASDYPRYGLRRAETAKAT
jgi:hypothetical protein